jgi:hypothetical protein
MFTNSNALPGWQDNFKEREKEIWLQNDARRSIADDFRCFAVVKSSGILQKLFVYENLTIQICLLLINE